MYNAFWPTLLHQPSFSISCAPELFQKRMSDILKQGYGGTMCILLVTGSSQDEHDEQLKMYIRVYAILNSDRCAVSRYEIKFFGNIVNPGRT